MIDSFRMWLKLLRPTSWAKNILVFAGVLFAQKIVNPYFFTRALAGFACFCAVASSIYIINDIMDRKADAWHPRKRNRPLASGAIKVVPAAIFSGLLGISGLVASWYLDFVFFKIILFYFFMSTAYSFYLKKLVIIDIICISMGFVLRAAGGAAAVEAEISPWLISCTFLLALFMAAGKRRSEVIFVAPIKDVGKTDFNDTNAYKTTRAVLAEYDECFLDHILTILSSLTVMCYLLYTFSSRTINAIGNDNLKFTVPVVVYGIFRYLLILRTKGIEKPETMIFRDRGMLGSIIVWIVLVSIIIYM